MGSWCIFWISNVNLRCHLMCSINSYNCPTQSEPTVLRQICHYRPHLFSIFSSLRPKPKVLYPSVTTCSWWNTWGPTPRKQCHSRRKMWGCWQGTNGRRPSSRLTHAPLMSRRRYHNCTFYSVYTKPWRSFTECVESLTRSVVNAGEPQGTLFICSGDVRSCIAIGVGLFPQSIESSK